MIKHLLFLITITAVSFPVSAYSVELMTDQELDSVTAQGIDDAFIVIFGPLFGGEFIQSATQLSTEIQRLGGFTFTSFPGGIGLTPKPQASIGATTGSLTQGLLAALQFKIRQELSEFMMADEP